MLVAVSTVETYKNGNIHCVPLISQSRVCWAFKCASTSNGSCPALPHESRDKPGMKVIDAKRLLRDAIAARLFNDMPMQSWNSRKILDTRVQPCLWVGVRGWACMTVKKAPKMQMWPKTFVHDCSYVCLRLGANIPTDGRLYHNQHILTPLHNINRQNVNANKFILGRLGENQPYKVQSTYVNTIIGDYWWIPNVQHS